MKRYAVVFEKAEKNWAAYVPDLPGCITTPNPHQTLISLSFKLLPESQSSTEPVSSDAPVLE